MKVAIVHDYLNQYGGAERVLEVLHELFPEAPVYTLIYDRTRMPEHFKNWNIKESFLTRFPFVRYQYEKYFFLMPLAIESFDLNSYDLVISISSAWSKGIITLPSTIHINYMLNPMRFAWNSYQPLLKARKGLSKVLLSLGLHWIRLWDENTSRRPDIIVTISKTVSKRIEKFYGIKPMLIYPPVNTDFFTPDKKVKKEDFFIIVSRLRPYKRIDIAISAFNDMKFPLLIIGEGSLKGNLNRSANRNIQFLGKRSDEEIRSFYRRAKAVIFPTFEDFGIVPLEAGACGTPVIAFKGGGAKETVKEGKNGVFFFPQTSEALMDTVLKFNPEDFDVQKVRAVSLKFSKENFIEKFRGVIEEITEKKEI
ncbi:MAG: glycosyltransferase family 4 protein [Candidatus Cloacimonadota bacterium]|nr:MAG: glycosyltransferase family 4 protein [Candidatus Cloacimonadota bacterium]